MTFVYFHICRVNDKVGILRERDAHIANLESEINEILSKLNLLQNEKGKLMDNEAVSMSINDSWYKNLANTIPTLFFSRFTSQILLIWGKSWTTAGRAMTRRKWKMQIWRPNWQLWTRTWSSKFSCWRLNCKRRKVGTRLISMQLIDSWNLTMKTGVNYSKTQHLWEIFNT